MRTDSVDKIITTYFACFTDREFTYRGVTYLPRTLVASPHLARGYTCPPICGGCCQRFSLDYLPSEPRPEGLRERNVDFDTRKVPIFSDLQTDHDSRWCRHLSTTDGRCSIHGVHPFSCDFELIRLRVFTDPRQVNRIAVQLYGRGHAFQRIDGGKGARCETVPMTPASQQESARKVRRLAAWMRHFGLAPTRALELVQILEGKPLRSSVVIAPR